MPELMRERKLKVVYVIRLSLDQMDGIARKVKDQILTWRRNEADARVLAYVNVDGNGMDDVKGWRLVFAPEKVFFIVRKIQRILQFLRGALIIVFWRPDIIYTRAGSTYWGSFLWKLSGAKQVVELSTTLEGELVSLSRAGHINEHEKQRRESDWRHSMEKANGYISVSYEIERQNEEWIQDKPSAVVWNSIDFSKYDSISRTNAGNRLPKVVFVGAANYEWNGLDKLLRLARRTIGKIEFVTIGVSPGLDVPENVKTYPFLDQEELPKVLSSCDVGMATLALHRKELEEASPLKVREYAALGIPMIISYQETPFINVALPEWMLNIPNSEESIDHSLPDILSFCDRWKGKVVDRNEARQFFDATSVEKKRIRFFNEIANIT
jgi:hypothetical protein